MVTLLALTLRQPISLPSITVPAVVIVVGPVYAVNVTPVCCHPVHLVSGNAGYAGQPFVADEPLPNFTALPPEALVLLTILAPLIVPDSASTPAAGVAALVLMTSVVQTRAKIPIINALRA